MCVVVSRLLLLIAGGVGNGPDAAVHGAIDDRWSEVGDQLVELLLVIGVGDVPSIAIVDGRSNSQAQSMTQSAESTSAAEELEEVPLQSHIVMSRPGPMGVDELVCVLRCDHSVLSLVVELFGHVLQSRLVAIVVEAVLHVRVGDPILKHAAR